jgi:hypothetical protein
MISIQDRSDGARSLPLMVRCWICVVFFSAHCASAAEDPKSCEICQEKFKDTIYVHKDTVEGFCELMSWKYMTGRGDTQEVSRILENGYTRGQVHALIAAEAKYQFYRVIHWIHQGEDSWLEIDKIERLLAVKDNNDPDNPADPGEPAWRQRTVSTRVPNALLLKGVSGKGDRRFALINNQTLERGETARVRIGSSNLLVRCLEIGERSVRVQVGELKEVIELSLSPQKTSD